MVPYADVIGVLPEAREVVKSVQRDLLPVVLWKLEKEGALGAADAMDLLQEGVDDLQGVLTRMNGRPATEVVWPAEILVALAALTERPAPWVVLRLANPPALVRSDADFTVLASWFAAQPEEERQGLLLIHAGSLSVI